MVGDKPQILFLILKVCQKSVFFFTNRTGLGIFFQVLEILRKQNKKKAVLNPPIGVFLLFLLMLSKKKRGNGKMIGEKKKSLNFLDVR